MSPKRLVLLVEGQGDVQAAPVLMERLLKEYAAFDAVFLDSLPPFRVGDYSKIKKDHFGEWRRLLRAATVTRKNVGGCILFLDGDSPVEIEGKPFCAARAARILVAEAEKVGAGKLFSLAVVFACMEFESWMIAGAESLENCRLADGRQAIQKLPLVIPADTEKNPRDAKGWFRSVMTTGYKPTRDQAELTRLVDLNVVRSRNVRSFRHLESAIQHIVAAIRSGNHIVSPTC
jgi:hypothetical protein